MPFKPLHCSLFLDRGSLNQHIRAAFVVAGSDEMIRCSTEIVTEGCAQISIVFYVLPGIERLAAAPFIKTDCHKMTRPSLLVWTECKDQIVIAGDVLECIEGISLPTFSEARRNEMSC